MSELTPDQLAYNGSMPAFPAAEAGNAHFGTPSAYMGVTIRDYFASKADFGNVDELTPQQGELVLGRPCPPYATELHACLEWWADFRATLRYIEADAMLRAREVRK